MDGILKVTPEKLMTTSTEFGNTGTQVNSVTQQMLDKIKALSSSWQGEASTAYLNKFNGLSDDMQKMFRMIQEHSKDLNDMAQQYSNAEKANEDLAAGLTDNVIS